jgi:hypothetical protein
MKEGQALLKTLEGGMWKWHVTNPGNSHTNKKFLYLQAQAVGLEIRILECIPYVSDMYRECILCAMYLRVKIHCILNVS